MRPEGDVLLLKSEMDDQEDDPHADRRVGDIEGRPMVGVHIDVEKIDHLAIPLAIDQIPDRPSKNPGNTELPHPIFLR